MGWSGRAPAPPANEAGKGRTHLDAIGEFNTLLIKRVGIAKQMAELLQQTCQRREPTPEPTRRRSSDSTPRTAARVNPAPVRRPVSDFTKLVRQLNDRGEASA